MRESIDAQHYHLGHSFERLERDGSGVLAYFGGGRRERADLLVGADGIRSTVRATRNASPADLVKAGERYAGWFSRYLADRMG